MHKSTSLAAVLLATPDAGILELEAADRAKVPSGVPRLLAGHGFESGMLAVLLVLNPSYIQVKQLVQGEPGSFLPFHDVY